jgi:hypothetical protein
MADFTSAPSERLRHACCGCKLPRRLHREETDISLKRFFARPGWLWGTLFFATAALAIAFQIAKHLAPAVMRKLRHAN